MSRVCKPGFSEARGLHFLPAEFAPSEIEGADLWTLCDPGDAIFFRPADVFQLYDDVRWSKAARNVRATSSQINTAWIGIRKKWRPTQAWFEQVMMSSSLDAIEVIDSRL
jgi:hypothetical protein